MNVSILYERTINEFYFSVFHSTAATTTAAAAQMITKTSFPRDPN